MPKKGMKGMKGMTRNSVWYLNSGCYKPKCTGIQGL